MNKRFALNVFFILAIITSAGFINNVSAARTDDGAFDGSSAPQISTTIVISQVYGGGGGSTGTYLNDYVELFNLSSSPQSLNGLALQYGSSTGQFGSSAANIFALPNVTLQPGQRFLVQLGSAGTGGAALPVAPDATTTSINAAAGSGKIALTNTLTGLNCGATATPCALPNANIIDLVSYGASNNGEGNTTVNNGSVLVSNQGAVRTANGCRDTDNNNRDFTVAAAPVPRNSASAPTPCTGSPAIAGKLFDFTGSGRTSFVTITRPLNGAITWKIAANPSLPGPNNAFIRKFNFGRSGDGKTFGDTVVPNDYTGDQKTEVAVYRDTDSTYFLAQTPIGTGGVTLDQARPWGDGSTDAPGGEGDYDGDGKADFTVVRANEEGNITWYILSSGTNTMKAIRFGSITTEDPTIFAGADFTGDGRDELIYAFHVGPTLTYLVGDANTGAGVITKNFGNFDTDSSLPPDDYTGDGRADFVAVRQTGVGSQAIWYINDSVTNAVTATAFGIPGFTATSDFPVRGDYDGDGRHDVAVWRPTNQTFYWINSSNGTVQGQQFGDSGDAPLGSLGLY